MNYSKRALPLFLFLSLCAHSISAWDVEFKVNGSDILTPVIQTAKKVTQSVGGNIAEVAHALAQLQIHTHTSLSDDGATLLKVYKPLLPLIIAAGSITAFIILIKKVLKNEEELRSKKRPYPSFIELFSYGAAIGASEVIALEALENFFMRSNIVAFPVQS